MHPGSVLGLEEDRSSTPGDPGGEWGPLYSLSSLDLAPAPPVIYDCKVPLQIHLQAHIAMWTVDTLLGLLTLKL